MSALQFVFEKLPKGKYDRLRIKRDGASQEVACPKLPGIPHDMVAEIAEGLNRSKQVQDPSLENLRGHFEEIKQVMAGHIGHDATFAQHARTIPAGRKVRRHRPDSLPLPAGVHANDAMDDEARVRITLEALDETLQLLWQV